MTLYQNFPSTLNVRRLTNPLTLHSIFEGWENSTVKTQKKRKPIGKYHGKKRGKTTTMRPGHSVDQTSLTSERGLETQQPAWFVEN